MTNLGSMDDADKRFLVEVFLTLSIMSVTAICGATTYHFLRIYWYSSAALIVFWYFIVKLMVFASNVDQDSLLLRIIFVLMASFLFGYILVAETGLSVRLVMMALTILAGSFYGYLLTAPFIDNLSQLSIVGFATAAVLGLAAAHFGGLVPISTAIYQWQMYFGLLLAYTYVFIFMIDVTTNRREGRTDAISSAVSFFA